MPSDSENHKIFGLEEIETVLHTWKKINTIKSKIKTLHFSAYQHYGMNEFHFDTLPCFQGHNRKSK